MNSDREARKKALEAAKARLAYRRKQKEQLQLLRQKKDSGAGTDSFDAPSSNYKKNDYGKKLVDDTKELINEWTSNKEKEDEKLEIEQKDADATANNQQTVPGPRADLNIVNSINTIDLMKRSRVEYVKEVQTDSVEIGQNANIINDQTTNNELNEILATFIENQVNPWPNQREEVIKRLTVEDADSKMDENDNEANDAGQGTGNEEKEQKAINVLSNEDAIKLISESNFLNSFRSQSKTLEAALGINEEHSVFIEAHSAIRDMTESSEMEKLIKSAEITLENTNGRAITCLEYDTKFGDRFLASYSGSLVNEQMSSGDGLINIFDAKTNGKLIRSLECQSMINCVQFHPTKENIVIGASVSGQVLGWDLRTNKKTPSIRTEFSSACHTQPIFALRFLPSLSSKIQQLVTLSNDAKLCVWRDDMLSDKPNHEFLLRLSKNNGNDDGMSAPTSTSTQAKEIPTTCFAYPSINSVNENENNVWLGSDEGAIYQTDLNLNKNDEKELAITNSVLDAHYGPITCIDFHETTTDHSIQNSLYLTSSFDWTVKLWHTSSSKPLALFNTMQDYVYDVKWSPTNPSIFAAGDGSGNLTIFDLNSSFEHPASEPTNIAPSERQTEVNPSITKLIWTPNGKQIIVGDSNGKISIFDCPIYDPVDNDFDKFEAIIKRKLESNDRYS